MKKFAFVILLLIPLIGFGQAEKRYRSIIVDSIKALNQDTIDIKDFAQFDSSISVGGNIEPSAIANFESIKKGFLMTRVTTTQRDNIVSPAEGLMVYNLTTNQFNFFDVSWQVVGGGGNTIYSADDNLATNRTITMGANSLTFDGNITTFKGVNATSSSFVLSAEDNVNTPLLRVENDGNIGIGILNPLYRLHIETVASNAIPQLAVRTGSNNVVELFNGITTGGGILMRKTSGTISMSLGLIALSHMSFGHNIGINTTAPNLAFTVKALVAIDGIQLENSSGNDHVLLITSSNGGGIRLNDNAGTTKIVNINDFGAGPDFINTGRNLGIGQTSATSLLDVDGDVEIGSADAYYLGDPTTNGTWRIIRSGDDLLMQQREAGVYVTKQTISGA